MRRQPARNLAFSERRVGWVEVRHPPPAPAGATENRFKAVLRSLGRRKWCVSCPGLRDLLVIFRWAALRRDIDCRSWLPGLEQLDRGNGRRLCSRYLRERGAGRIVEERQQLLRQRLGACVLHRVRRPTYHN